MTIEVSGAGFRNAGAELMLIAVRDELQSWSPGEDVAVTFRTGKKAWRDALGLTTLLRLDSIHREWANKAVGVAARAIPGSLLRAADVNRPSITRALLDVSGFAMGDQWGPLPCEFRERLFAGYARSGKPIVLLPQAFGPFADQRVADAARRALEYVDLVYARDDESLSHLDGLGLAKPILRRAPDFTISVKPPSAALSGPTLVVIPNARMVQSSTGVSREDYLAFLRTVASAGIESGTDVITLVHEMDDVDLADAVTSIGPGSVRMVQPAGAVEAKALIGGATLVVSSRYHGLASALSQGVPALGTSWSHKYEHLLAEFGCREALLLVGDRATTHARVTASLSAQQQEAARRALRPYVRNVRDMVTRMWSEVRDLMDD